MKNNFLVPVPHSSGQQSRDLVLTNRAMFNEINYRITS